MSAALITAMRTVADARAEAFAATEALRLKREQFAADNAALLEHEKTKKLEVERAEANAKALVAVHYEQTQDQAPVPGATVKLFATMQYDEARALEWSRATKLALVPESLDKRAFEKIAKATPLAFVTYGQDPRVQLATELNATDYLTTDNLPAAPAEVPV